MVCGIRERKLLFFPPSQQFSPARLCVPLLSFTTNGPFLSFAAVSFIVIVIYAVTLMIYSVLYVAAWFWRSASLIGPSIRRRLTRSWQPNVYVRRGKPCGLHLCCGWKCFLSARDNHLAAFKYKVKWLFGSFSQQILLPAF